jgi:hypothetical protein
LQVPPGRKETEAGFIDHTIQDAESSHESESESQAVETNGKKKDPEAISRAPTDPDATLEAIAEPSANHNMHLNFKIVPCRDLLKGEYSSSDPGVKVLLGKKELHRTKKLLKT